MENFERYRFQDFPWLEKDFDSALQYLEKEKNRELGVYLPKRDITPAKLDKLLLLAEENRFLDALMLDQNKLEDEGCKRLADYLRKDDKLKYLFLENNKITDEGLDCLLDGLKDNNTLKSIWLGRNQISDDGVAKFSAFVMENPQIREFSVGGQQMTDDGAFYIARALNSSKTITSCHLLDNQISSEGAWVLAQVAGRAEHNLDAIEVHSKEFPANRFSELLADMATKEAEIAFRTALENGEEGPWLRCKIMVVGQGRAGKTATVRSMLNLPFNQNLESTIGAQIQQSTTKKRKDAVNWESNKVEDAKVDLALDAATRLAMLRMQRQKNEQDEMMKNMTIEQLREKFRKDRGEREKMAQKREIAKANAIPKEMREEINSKFNAKLVLNKKAELEDISFTIWDYGGQKVFYTLHHLFLTKYGVYILAFDMRHVICSDYDKSTDEGKAKIKQQHAETIEYLEFWLNSVSMHAAEAPLMIVGTFLDAVESTAEVAEVNRFIEKVLGDKFPQVVRNGALSFFPLSNRNPDKNITEITNPIGGNTGSNIDTIRDTIEKVSRKQDFVNQKLSLRWIKCLDDMLGTDKETISLAEAYKIAARCGIPNEEEVDKMLRFFHELGMLVHLDSTQHLRDLVTLKPQWLIDALSKIIRDKELHASSLDHKKISKFGLTDNYQLMLKKNIVTRDWLEFLWEKSLVDFLIDLMKRTMLISEWKFGEFENEVAYLVPSLIDQEDENAIETPRKMLVQFSEEAEEIDAIDIANNKKGGNLMRKLFNRNKKKMDAQLNIKEGKETEAGMETLMEEEPEKPKGFYSQSTEVNSIVFDFTKSFLPNGVFQRLLCLCILKCTSDNKTAREPELFKSSATIHMEPDQIFRLYQYQKQILCVVSKDLLESYKVLTSMMNKLKSDVMGTGLEWDEYLEVVDEKDRRGDKKAPGFLHKYELFSDIKEKQTAPWFHPEEIEREEKIVEKKMGIELEHFLHDLSDF